MIRQSISRPYRYLNEPKLGNLHHISVPAALAGSVVLELRRKLKDHAAEAAGVGN